MSTNQIEQHSEESEKRLSSEVNDSKAKPCRMSESPKARQRAVMVALWKRMREYMGQSWVREYGDVDGEAINAWQLALSSLKEHQIAEGVKACQHWTKDFPPTFGQFRELCVARRHTPITPPPQTVAQLTAPRGSDSGVAKGEKERIAAIMRGEEVETKEASMHKLGFTARHGV